MKNILLTTLGFTKDLTDVEYFHFRRPDGELTYCTGISVAEAGTKYILATHHIDEIVVLGSPDAISEKDDPSEQPLAVRCLPTANELGDFSEYGFFCYRILQYMEELDIEANDIRESLSAEEQSEVIRMLDEFKTKYQKGVRNKDLFRQLDMRAENEKDLTLLRQSMSDKQWRWLKYSGYLMMDSFYKMHLLGSNRGVSVRFAAVRKNEQGAFDMQDLNRIIDTLCVDRKADVSIYMDLQGCDFCDGYSFFNVFSMLQQSSDHRIQIAGIIQSTLTADRLSSPILDEWSRLQIHELLTGINIFLNYGKADYILRYRDVFHTESPNTERMLIGMKYVEEGVSLCNIPVLKYGISVLKQTFSHDPPEQSGDLIYSILADTIEKDCGKLLTDPEVSVSELLNWVLRKKMYQQALTIIESQVPADLAERGIFYYARNREDAERVMEELNVRFWNDSRKNRYCYDDPAHFLFKYYPFRFVDRAQPPENRNKAIAHLHIARLHGNTQTLPAFSDLQNDDMLYELIYNYLYLSALRNEVCHALPPENALPNGEELVMPKTCESLDTALNRFAQIYSAACKRTAKNHAAPYLIAQDELRNYFKKHQLIPLQENEDGLLEKNVICTYNGRDVSIRIRMLEPESEEED